MPPRDPDEHAVPSMETIERARNLLIAQHDNGGRCAHCPPTGGECESLALALGHQMVVDAYINRQY